MKTVLTKIGALHFIAISLLVGIIFLIAGFVMSKYPPKNINELYGYRTTNAMKNQANWDLAQKLSTKYMTLSGFFSI